MEEDDVAIMTTLGRAVRAGGQVFVDTMHRDAAVASFASGGPRPHRLLDGTLMIEEPVLDPVAGRIETC